MKKTAIILFVFIFGKVFSQVRIGSANSVGNVSSTSVLLEFGTDNDKGIILPYTETLPSGTNNSKGGTFIFDVTSNTEYKIKVKNENTGWTDLSVRSGYSTVIENTVKTPQALPLNDFNGARAIIGNSGTSTDGVLVLDSPNKALVLPIVSNFTNIKNPSPGMMAFLKHPTDATKHRLIIFNGQKWTFWKP
ncbi:MULTISPECIES: hypothetical protein [Chryseobacterium]|uniref:Uncharacterized protein n=2 Tax=Chryseobacterium TaxID=59732 RepID=A0A3D9AR92_9FLAO|nr:MULTISPECIES: hypothetical protein [Chryseobacterium]OVE55776.1 hypothetical protein B0E34_16305 [Chryseobacterium mucoviscidosis]REC43436.1 hypothetical protein DRF68_16970 [Candidatus Chryseobacterium massiliae]